MRSCHGSKQVRRERRNAALARQVVADKRDLTNFGNFFHEAVFHSSRPALLRTRVCAPTANVPPQREESTLPGVENPLAGAREGYSGTRVIVDEPNQAIRRHGCIPAKPAAVSPGKIIVPRIVIGGVILDQPADGGIGAAKRGQQDAVGGQS